MEASGRPTITVLSWCELCTTYCLVLRSLNLIAHFHKLYPWTLKNSTPENQKKLRNKTTILRLRDPSAKKSTLWDAKKTRENETSRPIKSLLKILVSSQNFHETHVLEGVPFSTPKILRAAAWQVPVSFYRTREGNTRRQTRHFPFSLLASPRYFFFFSP